MPGSTASPSASMRTWAETHHIEFIPASARHGKPWHQLAFWWGSNVNVFNVVLGGVVVSIGLSFWQALAAITTGTVIGALLIALHATQGPRLGVPQSIQSRGQFGFHGAAFMFPCVLALNIGFIAAQFVIQAQALTGVTSALTIPQWIVLLAVPSLIIGIHGYRWIHRTIQATAIVVVVRAVRLGLHQVLAIGTMWRRFKPESVAVRVIPFTAVMAAGVVIALLGYGSFVTSLANFLDVLLVVFIPWSAVNLADYFAVRHGNYDVPSFFDPRGAYGRFAWRGLLARAGTNRVGRPATPALAEGNRG